VIVTERELPIKERLESADTTTVKRQEEAAKTDALLHDGVQPQSYDSRSTWKPRPYLSKLVRLAIFATPIVAASGTTILLSKQFFDATWPMPNKAMWFVFVFLLATAITARAKRGIDRFLPLSMLVRSNLAFPIEAPNRVKLALRMGNSANRERVSESFRESGLSHDPQVAAEQVLILAEELNKHDRRTRGHSEKVRALSDVIAQELGLSMKDRELLRWGSLLHDIGKLAVPANLLNKEGKPTDEEWQILKTHPAEGEWRLDSVRPWLGDWVRCAWEHHERFDGLGYPNGIKSSELPLGSRIVAVADAFEVMTSVRSYKKAMSFNDARSELARCAGTHFDPDVVRALLRVGVNVKGYGTGFFSTVLNRIQAGPGGSVTTAGTTFASSAAAVVLGAAAAVGPAPAVIKAAPKPVPVVELALRESPTTTTTSSTTTTTTVLPTTTTLVLVSVATIATAAPTTSTTTTESLSLQRQPWKRQPPPPLLVRPPRVQQRPPQQQPAVQQHSPPVNPLRCSFPQPCQPPLRPAQPRHQPRRLRYCLPSLGLQQHPQLQRPKPFAHTERNR
jgi:putative nucleotidyltransferase with HDIG domain